MTAPRVCPYCGQVHRESARFCPATGNLIPPAESVASQQANPQASPAGLTGRLPPNSLLQNRFLILQKIGQGGMAAVYQVADTHHPGTLWAVKEMSDAAITEERDRDYAVQAFLQEANLLRSLDHPNLPKVLDAFTERGKHYLVMEFVSGKTLAAMLEGRSQPFSEAEVLPWALQLCDVLIYLHSQQPKIIFRDLKPANIMLNTAGQIKLIDFGIARFFKPGKTKDTLALGTPGFASPEAAVGQTDERSDIYSLCVTLHHLLTLHDPSRAMFNLPAVRKLNPAVSGEMEHVLTCGLQNERDCRWQSVQELRAELIRLAAVSPAAVRTAVATPGAPGPALIAPLGGRIVAPSTDPGRRLEATPGGVQAGWPPRAARPVAPTQAAQPSSMPPLATSRPTTRLLMVATQLSGRQVALIGGLAVVVLVLATWLLAPWLDKIPFDWNQVPIVAIFAALGYAAYPKRLTAFISQIFFSTAFVATVWLALGTQGYQWVSLFLGALASAIYMEVWVAVLPRIRGGRGGEAWLREAVWLALMEIVGTLLFFGVVSGWRTGLDPIQWLLSALFGVAGWFVGDFLQQYLLYRRTSSMQLR